jgi:pilus assembly protein TadC
MAIENLKQNIEREKLLVNELLDWSSSISEIEEKTLQGLQIDVSKKKLIENSMNSLISQLLIINDAIPELIKSISFYRVLNQEEKVANKSKLEKVVNLKYTENLKNQEVNLVVPKKEENKFLENVAIHSAAIKKIQQVENKRGTEVSNETLVTLMIYSNKFFRDISFKLVDKGYFDPLKLDLRKITSPLLINSYVSLALFSTSIAFILGLFVSLILFIVGANYMIALLVILFIPLITFGLFYMYPSSTRKSLEKDINQELPFLTIFMAAIATSGIEPSKIFSILVKSKDYPTIQREIRKLTNYLNFYGYDLVSGLKLVSKNSPSERLSQLFDGLATAITSGGSMVEFLNKHSDSLLFDYRLEREKYTHLAETFMNIYISVVIAAPMIMMMLFILMSLTGFGAGQMSPGVIGFATVFIVSVLNMGFLVFLNIKQPKF